mmetsp:Transcript_6862/g.21643  ORF Transcript_6862/g.21643 Transcript_6862/m.21643 type:complete len:104 (+) Transcript_6862:362-673(+)
MTKELLKELEREVCTRYDLGQYVEALQVAEKVYLLDAVGHHSFIANCYLTCSQARADNLLALGAINFQLRNFSEALFYNQQVVLPTHLCYELSVSRHSTLNHI